MKHLLSLIALLCATMVHAEADSIEAQTDTLIFTTVKACPVTPVKNQNQSGTCWSYSSLSWLESEVMRTHPDISSLDLCESFVVSHTYVDRAERNIRTHGDASFSQGGSFYDVVYCMKHYGLIPEGIMPYPVMPDGDSLFNFSTFFAPMEAYVRAISESEAKKISPHWRSNVQQMVDTYFGPCPTTFTYEGRTYTPQTFVSDYLGLSPNDYVSLTSYSHQPFYEPFILEIQDNWRWEASYNLPLDEFMEVMDYCLQEGYTFAWGADVSEKGFERRDGKHRHVATVEEDTITQDMRQAAYDNWETTDDHGMHIYGIATDQHGQEYYMMKNSWGTDGPYNGHWYVSKPYAAYKTMNIMLNKRGIPKHIRKKLGI